MPLGAQGGILSDAYELDISRQTLYRHISPTGQLRPDAKKLLANEKAD